MPDVFLSPSSLTNTGFPATNVGTVTIPAGTYTAATISGTLSVDHAGTLTLQFFVGSDAVTVYSGAINAGIITFSQGLTPAQFSRISAIMAAGSTLSISWTTTGVTGITSETLSALILTLVGTASGGGGSGGSGGGNMAGAVIDPGNTIWTRGYVYGTIGAGVVDDVPFGEMQDFSLKDTIGLKEVMGAGSLGAVAVGIHDRKITGNCKWLKVRARDFVAVRGGSAVYGAPSTTYSAGINDEPTYLNLHFSTPSDGSIADLKVFHCLAPDLTLPLQQRDFSIPDITFNVYGDGTNFYTLKLPGDQSTS